MKKTLNILFGPPKYGKERMVLSFFFNLPGKHIVCGGTTANIVSDYFKKPLTVDLFYVRNDVPPAGRIEGVDLVTEGLLTLKRVKGMFSSGETPDKDAASAIYREMTQADEINFVCGVLTDEKKELINQLLSLLEDMGKKVCAKDPFLQR